MEFANDVAWGMMGMALFIVASIGLYWITVRCTTRILHWIIGTHAETMRLLAAERAALEIQAKLENARRINADARKQLLGN